MTANAFAAALMLIAAQISLRPPGMERPPLRPGTATIAGHVIDAITEKPVTDVEVQLTDDESQRTAKNLRQTRIAIAITSADGSFTFSNIAAGSYHVFVTSKTHLPECYGACAAIVVEDDQDFRNANVFVRPAAIIKGRVLDHEGSPLLRGSVSVTFSDGDHHFGLTGPVIDGTFEIGGLQPGTVTISVNVATRNGAGMVRAYYPGVLQASEAIPLSIDVGAPLEVEIRVPRIVLGSINARVSGPEGLRIDKLTLNQPEAKSILPLTREGDGVAHVINLREGRYVIEARGNVNGKLFAAFTTAIVGDGETEVPIELTETGSVYGRIVAERGGLPPLGNVRIAAVWILDGAEVDAMRSDETSVRLDGSFSLNGLFGSRVFQVSGLESGWEMVSVRAGRSDITGRELDVASGSRTEIIVTVARR